MSSTEKQALRQRAEALGRFEEWSSAHPTHLPAAAAIAAAGQLYELLPLSSRHRPVDPGGVMRFHRLLSRASGQP
jgi:hypothetical protein